MAPRAPFEDVPTFGPALKITRLPQDPDELWWWFAAVFGVRYPRVQVCDNHVAPFDVVWAMYSRQFPMLVVKGSRGFSGKSYLLGTAAIGIACLQGVHVNVLGGSAAQSLNVHEISQSIWFQNYAPRSLLLREPSRFETLLTQGGRIRALLASSRSVRGPHPNLLLLDEIDEMELPLIDSALGQAMPQTSGTAPDVVHDAMNVLISTHHYPDKAMTAMWNRAEEKNPVQCDGFYEHPDWKADPDDQGWRRVTWCYRESMLTSDNPTGWLAPTTVEQKRREVSSVMWHTEYENQDPAVLDTLLDPDSVVAMWDERLGHWSGKPGEVVRIAEPVKGANYIHGVDWAKKRDWTVHMIWRPDPETKVWHLVYFLRLNRLPWPQMVAKVMDELKRYPGGLAHDATGVGDVVGDLFPEQARRKRDIRDIVMRGQQRSEMFEAYIRAVEDGAFKAPRIDWAYEEHLYCRYEDLHSTSGHPPDSIVAGSMSWLQRRHNLSIDVSTLGQTFPSENWAFSSANESLLGSGWDQL